MSNKEQGTFLRSPNGYYYHHFFHCELYKCIHCSRILYIKASFWISNTDFNENFSISGMKRYWIWDEINNFKGNFLTKFFESIEMNSVHVQRSVFSVSKVTCIIKQQCSLPWLERLRCWWCTVAQRLIYQKWKEVEKIHSENHCDWLLWIFSIN